MALLVRLPTDTALGLIRKYESGGQNIYNYRHNENPNYYTASGPYQIVNSTWKTGAGLAGVDTNVYPTAISAPVDVQDKVAGSLYNTYGFSPWQGNAKLQVAIGNAEGHPTLGNVVTTPPVDTNTNSVGAAAPMPDYTTAPSGQTITPQMWAALSNANAQSSLADALFRAARTMGTKT